MKTAMIWITIMVGISAVSMAQTRPHADSSKKKQPVVKPKENKDSVLQPKGYYVQPKDVRGKDSNKVGSTPK
jgi:hypothetical protein